MNSAIVLVIILMILFIVGGVYVLYKNMGITRGKPPEFRLVPDAYGSYRLEQWDNQIGRYSICRSLVKDQKEANKIIEHLGKKTLFWTGEDDEQT